MIQYTDKFTSVHYMAEPKTINNQPLYDGDLIMKWLDIKFGDLLKWQQKTNPEFEFHNDTLYLNKQTAESLINYFS